MPAATYFLYPWWEPFQLPYACAMSHPYAPYAPLKRIYVVVIVALCYSVVELRREIEITKHDSLRLHGEV